MKIIKKYNQKNIIKRIKAFTYGNDIKPEISGIYIDKEKGVIVATDSHKLVELSYITGMETGIYNLDTLQKIDGSYPDYKQIFYPISEATETENTTVEKLNNYVTTCAMENIAGTSTIKYFDKNFNKDSLIQAVELFQAILANDIIITYKENKPLIFKSDQCTILIMTMRS